MPYKSEISLFIWCFTYVSDSFWARLLEHMAQMLALMINWWVEKPFYKQVGLLVGLKQTLNLLPFIDLDPFLIRTMDEDSDYR